MKKEVAFGWLFKLCSEKEELQKMKIESAGWGSIGEEKKEKKREKKCCRWLATGQTQSE